MKNHPIISNEEIFDGYTIPIVILDLKDHCNTASHSHSFYEFVYVESGFSLHIYDEVTTILTSGDLFATRPGEYHSYTSNYHAHIYNCLFLLEALDGVRDMVIELPGIKYILDRGDSYFWKRIHLDVEGRREAVELLDRMKWERVNKSTGWELQMKSLLTSFLILFSRTYSDRYRSNEEKGSRYSNYVYKALKFIEENFRESISTCNVADAAGISPDYLARQFRQLTGLTPMEYIKNFRFAKAVESLCKVPSVDDTLNATPLTVSTDIGDLHSDSIIRVADIAAAVGIDDPAYFSRQFKQIMGMSPSEYRKMLSNKKGGVIKWH
ncbi:MAG: AraC family transcriptional regulator [Clostridiales bacterium]|nr:AraC family transcriptional regulator [Clostridiales bacterium]